jgi:D-glycero-alpha-D-manno-heptose-7-phosphate kinase
MGDQLDNPVARKTICAVAPIRIVDNGGWTDTWFAGHGSVFNIAVTPNAEVQVEVFPARARTERLVVVAENYGERFEVVPGRKTWAHHPLLEAAIDYMNVPEEHAIRVTIYSDAPAGASTGTSAAVTVALIAALTKLSPTPMAPREIARTAHHIEMDILGFQCGIQDQICSALGGINFIDMDRFPNATVTPVPVTDETWWELERRLVLIYLGSSHNSSDVHRKVIRELESEGSESPRLEALRHTARASRDAVVAADFRALGRAMIENTEAQARLHPDIVGAGARGVLDIARDHGAEGWKVNGAGGDGGSVSILTGPDSGAKRAMIREIQQSHPRYRNLPILLSRTGVRTWETR